MIANRQYITKTWTIAGYFFTVLWIWIIALVLVGESASGILTVLSLGALAIIYVFAAPAINARRLSKRTARLAAFAATHNLRHADVREARQFRDSLGAIERLHNAREPKIKNLLVGDDWEYADFTYNVYGQYKGGEYLRARVYYAVMSAKLPRRLPNVFFDSKKARGRQFRFHFAKSQRHSLEGDFDKFFVTYFPSGYAIDSMSIISPDVMWAMRDASDYDIEIYGDRVFLYGALYDPERQLPDMAAKITRIKKELLDNILTYRDQRLPYDEGRKRVAGGGVSLKIGKFWKIVSIITVVLYIALRMAVEFLEGGN